MKQINNITALCIIGIYTVTSISTHVHCKNILKQHDEATIRNMILEEIPYFTISGLQVRYLKILEKSGYQALPWVRYITQNGDYQIRMSDIVQSGNR